VKNIDLTNYEQEEGMKNLDKDFTSDLITTLDAESEKNSVVTIGDDPLMEKLMTKIPDAPKSSPQTNSPDLIKDLKNNEIISLVSEELLKSLVVSRPGGIRKEKAAGKKVKSVNNGFSANENFLKTSVTDTAEPNRMANASSIGNIENVEASENKYVINKDKSRFGTSSKLGFCS